MKRLEGKTYIVTGGAKGIGGAIAWRLEHTGLESSLKQGLEHASTGLMFQTRSRFSKGSATSTRISAGLTGRSIEEQSIVKWRRIVDVNLTGPWLCSKHVVKYVKKAGGVIVNIASTRALQSEPNTEP